jgi:hypothetical protein
VLIAAGEDFFFFHDAMTFIDAIFDMLIPTSLFLVLFFNRTTNFLSRPFGHSHAQGRNYAIGGTFGNDPHQTQQSTVQLSHYVYLFAASY